MPRVNAEARPTWMPKREYLRRQLVEEIEQDVKDREVRGEAPLERPSANGVYVGPAQVREVPPGVGFRKDTPGRLGVRKGAFTRNKDT